MVVDADVLAWTEVGMRRQGLGEYVRKGDVERLLEEADNRRRLQMQGLIDQLREQLRDEGYEPCA